MKRQSKSLNMLINVCDSCKKEVDPSEFIIHCTNCNKELCYDCVTIVKLSSPVPTKRDCTFYICPECKGNLTIEQLEDKLNEKV